MHKIRMGALALALMAVLSITASPASAAPLVPSFDGAPSGWTTDRYQPNVFADIGVYQGRNDVLQIGISSAQGATSRPAGQTSGFYNTQGMKYAVTGGAGSWIAADLWVDETWRHSDNAPTVRTDLWGLLGAEPGNAVYPIIGFTNLGGSTFQVWDSEAAGWQALGATVNYGAWNSLAINYTGSAFNYYVNGALMYTDLTIATTSTMFSDVFLQAYNYHGANIGGANAQDYSAHWSNTQSVPEPATFALFGLGLVGAGIARRRRLN